MRPDSCTSQVSRVLLATIRSIHSGATFMTDSGLNKIRLLAFTLVLAATSCAQRHSSVPEEIAKTRGSTPEEIAKTYGLDSFRQIEAIRYTWNGQFSGA